jgi:hypothetical protein
MFAAAHFATAVERSFDSAKANVLSGGVRTARKRTLTVT